MVLTPSSLTTSGTGVESDSWTYWKIIRFIHNIPGLILFSNLWCLNWRGLKRQHNFKFCVDTCDGTICQLVLARSSRWSTEDWADSQRGASALRITSSWSWLIGGVGEEESCSHVTWSWLCQPWLLIVSTLTLLNISFVIYKVATVMVALKNVLIMNSSCWSWKSCNYRLYQDFVVCF